MYDVTSFVANYVVCWPEEEGTARKKKIAKTKDKGIENTAPFRLLYEAFSATSCVFVIAWSGA